MKGHTKDLQSTLVHEQSLKGGLLIEENKINDELVFSVAWPVFDE